MKVETAVARYRGVDYPGVIERHGAGWLLAGVIDGEGSWGAGTEAADWTRRQLLQQWADLSGPSAAQIVDDIQAVVDALPAEYRDSEFGCAFSIALTLLRGQECYVIAAGAYGVQMVNGAASNPLFMPRHWIDVHVEEGRIAAEDARSHPLRQVIAGPWVADEPIVAPPIYGPFRISAGSSTVIADERIFERLTRQSAESWQSLSAAAIQALLEQPATPVVVIRA